MLRSNPQRTTVDVHIGFMELIWQIARISPPFLGIALLICATGCGKPKPAAPPPPDVEVMTVSPTNVAVYQEWIGTLDGFGNAQIRAQVSGYLMSQNYKEGSLVKKGDVLFQINPRLFQAQLDQAKAQLGVPEADMGITELSGKRL